MCDFTDFHSLLNVFISGNLVSGNLVSILETLTFGYGETRERERVLLQNWENTSLYWMPNQAETQQKKLFSDYISHNNKRISTVFVLSQNNTKTMFSLLFITGQTCFEKFLPYPFLTDPKQKKTKKNIYSRFVSESSWGKK